MARDSDRSPRGEAEMCRSFIVFSSFSAILCVRTHILHRCVRAHKSGTVP
jgi:hypothetical protein